VLVTLGTPTNALLGTPSTVTVIEGPPVTLGTPLQLGATFSFPVLLTAPATQDIAVPFSFSGSAGTSGVTASPLVIHAGQASGVITGTFTDGGLGGPSQTVTVTLGTPSGAALLTGTQPATLSEGTEPAVSLATPVQTGSIVNLQVSLSNPSPFDTMIPFTLGGNEMLTGVTASPLVIPAGQMTAAITGTLADNGQGGPAQFVSFTLGSPTNATLGSPTTVNFSEGPTATLLAGNQIGANFNFPVLLSAATTHDISIPFTISGSAGVSGVTASPLVIHAGHTSGTITGTFSDGGLGGPSQTVTVTLGTPTGGTLLTGTQPATLAEASEPAVELGTPVQTGANVSVQVTLSDPSPLNTIVPFTVGGNVGLSGLTPTPLLFAAGQTTATISGTLVDQGQGGPSKNVVFTLGTPTRATLGSPTSATLTEAPLVSIGQITQIGAAFSVPVTLSTTLTQDITVPFTVSGTATVSGVTAGPLVIQAGQSSATISGTFSDGGLGGPSKTVLITLGTPTGAALLGGAQAALLGEATEPIASLGTPVQTGPSFTLPVVLSNTSPFVTTIPFTVGGSAGISGGTPSPLVIAAGQLTGTIAVTLADSGQGGPGQNVSITLGTPTNATLGSPASATLTEGQIATFGTPSQSGATFSFPVSLSAAAAQDISIPFTLAGTAGISGFTASPLVIHAGQASGVITGTLTDGGLGGPSQTVTVTLGTPTGAALATGTQSATLAESSPPTVVLGTPVQTGGTFHVPVTLLSSSPVMASVPYTLSGNEPITSPTPGPLVFAPGQTTATISGILFDGGQGGPSYSVTFTLGTPANATLGSPASVTLTEGPTVAFGTPSQSGATFSFPVLLSAAATQDVTIPFTTAGSAGISGLSLSPLVIPAGQKSGIVSGTYTDGGQSGPSHTVTVTLGTPLGASLLGGNQQATLGEATPPVATLGTAVQTGATFSIVVSLSSLPTKVTTVPFTLGGNVSLSGATSSPLVFGIGQTTATISGTLADGGQGGPSKNVTVTLGAPTNAGLGNPATITVSEGPTVTFGTPSQIDATFSLPVVLSATATADVTVPFTLGGTAGVSGVSTSPLVIHAGQRTGFIVGTLTDGGLGGSSQTVTAALGTPTGAALAAGGPTATSLSEASTPTLTFGSPLENGTAFSIPVFLSRPSPFSVSVPFTLSGSAGITGVLASPLVVARGQTTAFITGTFTDGGYNGSAKQIVLTVGTPAHALLSSPGPFTFIEGTLSISGTIFFDYNSSGTLNPGEPGLAGRTVYLDLHNDATLDPGDPTTVSDQSGNFTISNIVAGSYTVREVLPFANVMVTGAAAGGIAVKLVSAPATVNFGNIATSTAMQVLTSANLFGKGNANLSTAFIQGLYHALLGRSAGASEVAPWLNALSGGLTRQQAAQDISASAEHRGIEVDAYYRTLLHRVESPAERTGWVNFFLAGGSEAQVVADFMGSAEYQSEHASNAAFATALYADILGRSASSSELKNVESQLAAGTVTRAQFIAAFLDSQEAYQLAVESFYVAYLHRNAYSDPQSSTWVNLLLGGQTLAQVQSEILGTGEFFNDGSGSVGP
jgi:hypothetical protein